MIRLALLTLGFIGTTTALLWSFGSDPASDGGGDLVTRGQPDTLSLQPALTLLAPAGAAASQADAPDTSVRPQARPSDLASVAPQFESAPTLPLGETNDDVINRLRAMSYGIVEEMKKPVGGNASASVSRPAAVAVPTVAETVRRYTVQQGDSLPGIAFRFYGTTVAYLDILSANRDILDDPSELRAGMTLRIPEL